LQTARFSLFIFWDVPSDSLIHLKHKQMHYNTFIKLQSFYDLISVSTVDDTTIITEPMTENEQTMSTTKALVILVVIFSLFILILGYLYYSFPQMTEYVVKKN